jgi:4-diphosphocytidyl-2-C-methyl-D-erythritol kinase
MVRIKLDHLSIMHSNYKDIKSFAKINLGLKILDLLPDGYHAISTIMQEIDLHDLITIEPIEQLEIKITCTGPVSVPPDYSNLCVQAAQLIFSNYNCNHGIHIFLNKNIPVGAGLGGGSSNAATILCSLNKLFKLKINDFDLHQLAFQLGCDVPFFINGGIQLSEGKGEILSPVSINLNKYYMVLVLPEFSVSTKWAYSFFKNDLSKTFDSNKFRSFQHDIDWALFENDFEKVINLTYPEVGQIRDTLESKEALFVSLSGSGSTMFGIFDNFLNADLARQALKTYKSHIVRTINRV